MELTIITAEVSGPRVDAWLSEQVPGLTRSAAQRLLAEGALSCTEIAYRCGFSGSSQFAMLFRRETGMTPTAFRAACRSERQNG